MDTTLEYWGDLPAEPTSFVGRTRELAEVAREFGRSRLITLTGVGGVGKSRLALRAAARAAPTFADGARYVPLAPLHEPALIGHVLLAELRLNDQTSRAPEEIVARWLADKELLLVLDSCEHLVGACARLVRTLLAAAPGLRVLATSRQPLSVPDERPFELDPLPVPRSAAAPDRPVGRVPGDAVELFVERAAEAVEGFALGPGDEAAAAAVCRRLDGIPLALELAAARLADLPEQSVYRLNDELQHRFETLTARSGPAGRTLPRHRTLRTTIGWSHELCAPLERLLWARLSVFTGSFDLVGARAVGSGGPLRDEAVAGVLEGLVTKSLVRRPYDGVDRERFHMLDTVREYGAHWLYELGEEGEARGRHRDFYQDLARQADAAWMGPGQDAWHSCLVAEHANIRTALDFCLHQGESRAALEMAGNLWMMWFGFGYAREGAHYLERALDHPAIPEPEPEPRPEVTKALWALSLTCLSLGDADRALHLSTLLRKRVTRSDDPAAPALAAMAEGSASSLLGQQDRAATVFDSMPRQASDQGPYVAAWFLAQAGRAFVHTYQGEFAAAEEQATAMIAECDRRGEQWVRAYAEQARAMAAAGSGRPAQAVVHARAAIAAKSRFRDNLGMATAMGVLATSTAHIGQPERAARLLGIAQRIWLTLGRPLLGAPALSAARAKTEHLIREQIGDAAYEQHYTAGLSSTVPEGITYSLHPQSSPTDDD